MADSEPHMVAQSEARVRPAAIPVWSYLERKLRKRGNRLRTAWRERMQPDIIRLGGVRIPIDRALYSDKIIRRLYDGGYEREERDALVRTLRPADRVLELGAGIGYLSAVAAGRIGSGRVTTCEANPQLLPAIARVHELNDVRPRVLHGVMSERGDIDRCHFYKHRNFWSSSLQKPEGQYEIVSVPVLHWQSELARLEPSYLVMDIEGGEVDLLEHFRGASVERMLIEFHPRKTGQAGVDRVLERLAAQGFGAARVEPGAHIYYFER
ncbi:MAG: FkbM family methyltransferase [Salinisphaera sp.]|uniref:FkbM family methyltransferase n=1 Tax=Salinisphaera sp. TaxID=1914330 RepID=UPI003C7E7329